MIPYDDLVAALSAWRARQGLPVSTLGGGGTAAAPQPGSGPTASPGSGPYAQGGSGPYRGAPPAPPPGRAKQPSVPPPLAMGDEMHEVDDAEMLEEQYETEGSDFAMAFGAGGPDDSSTAIGGAPERPTDPNDINGGRGGGGRDDW
ncbi:MAG TPA: hypothetical protein VIV40_33145 [Kofleriaceae bacterium]